MITTKFTKLKKKEIKIFKKIFQLTKQKGHCYQLKTSIFEQVMVMVVLVMMVVVVGV